MNFISIKDVKKRVDLNYECLKELEHLILQRDSKDEKLELITFVGKMYSTYITGVYSSNILEQQIIKLGKGINYQPCNEAQKGRILIVMSACADVGGHTVLVHNWIKWDDDHCYSIVFTNMDENQTPDFIRNVVEQSGGTISYLSGSYTEKALKLLEISEGFWRILLFTHMEDIIPVLAYSNKHWRIPVYFYNHADFRFSYGFSVSDIVLNLTEFDLDKTIRFRGICEEDSVYLQFPGYGQMDKGSNRLTSQESRAIINKKYGLETDEKLIVSMGSDFKFENIIGYEFDSFVVDVLKRYDGKCSFLIIGADKEKKKWIQLNKRTHGKAKALGILKRSEAEQLISGADVYIISFPMSASGRQNAESAGTPWLGLSIYGRGVRKGDIRFSESVNELVEKTVEILNGNGKKYLEIRNMDIWTKQEWKDKWREICNSVTHHEVRPFCPQRYVEKQEYVNCQLMQEEAAQIVFDYINEYKLSEEMRKEFFRLDRQYDMGVIYKYAAFLEERSSALKMLSNKHLQLYLTAIRWIGIKQKGERINEYLSRQGYQTAAIYGMSYMGKALAEELNGSNIDVLYGIDRNVGIKHSDMPVFHPSEKLKKVDIILNTTTVENWQLAEMIHMENPQIIQITDILIGIEKEKW
ncbi:MAG: hypothetical protein HFH12_00730 [Dorea sp.]|nr:hypothetical protein [Dorea sp.]